MDSLYKVLANLLFIQLPSFFFFFNTYVFCFVFNNKTKQNYNTNGEKGVIIRFAPIK